MEASEETKSTYSLPSRSQTCAPRARAMNNGEAPTGYCVRLFENVWLPKGIEASARARNASERWKVRRFFMVAPWGLLGRPDANSRTGFAAQFADFITEGHDVEGGE